MSKVLQKNPNFCTFWFKIAHCVQNRVGEKHQNYLDKVNIWRFLSSIQVSNMFVSKFAFKNSYNLVLKANCHVLTTNHLCAAEFLEFIRGGLLWDGHNLNCNNSETRPVTSKMGPFTQNIRIYK